MRHATHEDIERLETRGDDEYVRLKDDDLDPNGEPKDIHAEFIVPTLATPRELEAAGQQRLDFPRPRDYCLRCFKTEGVSYLMGKFNCAECEAKAAA
jgi:hypothetical protein